VFLELVKAIRGQRFGVPEPAVLVGGFLVAALMVVVRVGRPAGTVAVVSRLIGRTHVAEHPPVFPVAVHLSEQLLGDHDFVRRRSARTAPRPQARKRRRAAADRATTASSPSPAVLFGQHRQPGPEERVRKVGLLGRAQLGYVVAAPGLQRHVTRFGGRFDLDVVVGGCARPRLAPPVQAVGRVVALHVRRGQMGRGHAPVQLAFGLLPGQLQLVPKAVAVQSRVAQHAGGPDAREKPLERGRLVSTGRRLSQRPHGLVFGGGSAVPGREAVQRVARLAPPQPLQPLAHFPAPSDQLYNDKNKI